LLSLVMFAGSIVFIWILIVHMPVDYLTRVRLSEESFCYRHPVTRVVTVVAKNVFGLLLVIMGVVMLLTPGQGLLSVFIGLTLLDFPGKKKLIRRLLGRRGVLNMINKIRSKARRPPLETPGD
jgi:hypothetical protein